MYELAIVGLALTGSGCAAAAAWLAARAIRLHWAEGADQAARGRALRDETQRALATLDAAQWGARDVQGRRGPAPNHPAIRRVYTNGRPDLTAPTWRQP